jgi:hypothetical protein
MLDEINRLKLMKRYEQHMAGLRQAKMMIFERAGTCKPYVYRPLKNKPIPMPDQGLEWVPRLTHPLVDLNPPAVRLTVYGLEKAT